MEGTDPAMTAHISDKQILAIATVARNEWQEIGICLGFEGHELSSYEHKFRDDLENRLIDILFSWKDREDNPTLGKVFEACKDAKVGAAVRRALLAISKDESEHDGEKKATIGASSQLQVNPLATTAMEGTDPAMTAHISDKQILAVRQFHECHMYIGVHALHALGMANLFQIATVARNEWQEIGICLGFEKHELSSYEHKFRDDLENRLIDILFSWKDREDNPTLGKVFEACKDAKVGAAVRRALLAISKVRAELESRCSRNCKGKLRQAIAVF
jgi:hypothetical protein